MPMPKYYVLSNKKVLETALVVFSPEEQILLKKMSAAFEQYLFEEVSEAVPRAEKTEKDREGNDSQPPRG